MSTSSVDGPRPQVPTTYVIPTLAGWAHKVFELSSSTDGAQPCIFLGPQQAHERVAGSSPVPPIAGIVNCTNSFPNVEHDSIDFCRVAVNDENGANILVYLDGATRFIDRTLKLGGSVLVHCQMGVSRSATVVIAYLMRYHSFSRDDAYRHVKERRPQIRPNEGFWRQLNIYQARLTGRTTDSTAHNQVFDREWAEQSLANFQTIGHLIDDKAECFPEVTPRTNESQILFVATDFVFGRGNQDADLPWFGALCFTLFKRGLDPMAAFDDLLSAGSDFVELWSGEVYPRDVERLTSTIRSAIGSTYGAEDTCFPKTQAP